MKTKLMLAAVAATMVSGAAFAASVPVTTVQPGHSKVQVTYMTAQKMSVAGDSISTKTNVGAALQTTLTPNWAVQYSYNPIKTKTFSYQNDEEKGTENGEIKVHELVGVYKYNDNVNFYGGLQLLKANASYSETNLKTNATESGSFDSSKLGVVGGVIGHTALTSDIDGFAKLGFGNNMSYDAQIGATYKVMPALGLSLSYDLNKYNVENDFSPKHKGLNLSLGYSF